MIMEPLSQVGSQFNLNAIQHHRWQHDTNELTNGLTRQYSPKRRNLHLVTSYELSYIVLRLNHHPRERLEIKPPHKCCFTQTYR